MNEDLQLIRDSTYDVKYLIAIADREKKKRENFDAMVPYIFLLFLFIFARYAVPIIFAIVSYIISSLKSKQIRPITRTPMIPWSQNGLKEFKYSKNILPDVRIHCDNKDRDSITKKFDSIMIKQFNLLSIFHDDSITKYYKNNPIPRNARLISIKMENFKHGLKCHDFVPIDGEAPGSYYTYQMFGDNRIQVTNYVVNGITYVAGLCIYIPDDAVWAVSYRKDVIMKLFNSPKYPGRDISLENEVVNVTVQNEKLEESIEKEEEEKRVWLFDRVETQTNDDQLDETEDEEKLIIKYCPSLKRKVMSKVESDVVIHQEWNPIVNEMKKERCPLCSELLNKELPPTYSSLSLV